MDCGLQSIFQIARNIFCEIGFSPLTFSSSFLASAPGPGSPTAPQCPVRQPPSTAQTQLPFQVAGADSARHGFQRADERGSQRRPKCGLRLPVSATPGYN